MTQANAVSNLFGRAKVITPERVLPHWSERSHQRDINHLDRRIRYRPKKLGFCAYENRQGLADWRLVYLLDLYLTEQYKLRGTDPESQPCFFDDGFNLEMSVDSLWSHSGKQEAGYRLIDFYPRFSGLAYPEQQQAIKKMGKAVRRCPIAWFTEALFTVFVTCGGERIAGDWYHWGPIIDATRNSVCAGHFDQDGVNLRYWSDLPHLHLGVCLVQEWDF